MKIAWLTRRLELVEAQRTVVHRRRQPEAVLDEDLLARAVAGELAVQLGHGHVALVDHEQPVVGEVVEQRERRVARPTPVEVPAVVLDPAARPDLGEHLEVVLGPHAEPLGLEQLALALELAQALAELRLDRGDGAAHRLVAGDVVRRREDDKLVELAEELPGERVEAGDPLDLVPEELDPHRGLLVRGVQLDRVAADPELAADQVLIVPVVLEVDEAPEDGALVVRLARVEHEDPVPVLLGRAETVDGRDRGDDDHVPARQQAGGRRVAQPVDLVVDRRVLLDVGVRGRQVRLGLVVVVVRDEVLDPVVREELPELPGQLGRERLVRGDDERRPLGLLDRPGDGRALPGPGDAEQCLVALPGADPLGKRLDRLRLVPCR